MKRFALILAMAVAGLSANAQMPRPEQVDTLVVKSVRYNRAEIKKENWPADVILKSASDITIGDNEYDIESMKEGSISARYGARELIFTLDGGKRFSFYENGVHRVVVFSGYEFFCEPSAEKDLKQKARRTLHAADSLAGVAEEKITESIRSNRNR